MVETRTCELPPHFNSFIEFFAAFTELPQQIGQGDTVASSIRTGRRTCHSSCVLRRLVCTWSQSKTLIVNTLLACDASRINI